MDRVLFAHRVLPALRPDVAHDLGPYEDWVRRREAWRPLQFVPRPDAEALNLVMVIAGEPTPETVQTLQALAQQTSPHWTLTVVVRNSWQTAFTALLGVSGLHRTSQRVRVEETDDSAAPSDMLSRGLAANAGAPVALLFPGDIWAPDTVAQLASALSPLGVVYADEDSVTTAGTYVDPRLKPSYSAEFLLSSAYIGTAARRRIGASPSESARPAPACPTSNTIWPCGPARGRARSSISQKSCAIDASARRKALVPRNTTSGTWPTPCGAGVRWPR